ncbi:ubiquinone biosynthesis protein UbiJ [Budvicia diplopodorum]|uniref:ubiquinone biosynthesis protein UbiJ n=1 Tax=Budvicia diplopodorum TaxID=1119056 RepID=UPI001357ED69|nr:SCP2 domain-containing protein [Budvicia diplopodorum]
MLFVPLIAGVIETSLNRLLFRDRSMQSASYRLSGKTLKLSLQELSTSLTLVFSVNHLDVVSQWEQPADCTLITRLPTLFSLRDRQRLSALLRDGEVVVEGDMQVMQQFVTLIDLAEWDPAEWLSPYIGDVAAETINQGIQSVGRKTKHWIDQKQEYLALAMTDEWRLAPGRLEVVHFSDEAQALSQQVDSLAQRIDKLEKAR